MASTYGVPDWHQHLERTVASALLAHHSWLGLSDARTDSDVKPAPGKRLLDYACGPGMVTRTFAPYVDAAVGVDVSERMVERYRELASLLKPQKIDGIVGNLVDGECDGVGAPANYDSNSSSLQSLHNFDLAVVGLGFHHFDDPVRAVKALASRLRDDGGVLLIVDFVGGCGSKDDQERAERQKLSQSSLIPEAMHDTVRVHGFDRKGVEEMFTAAGLKAFEWDEIEEKVVLIVDGERKERRVFLAKGTKA